MGMVFIKHGSGSGPYKGYLVEGAYERLALGCGKPGSLPSGTRFEAALKVSGQHGRCKRFLTGDSQWNLALTLKSLDPRL